MNIKSDLPQIAQLKRQVEQSIDFPLSTHGDFLRLSAGIEFTLREHMSESTLERLWGYSTRHYESVSMRTLNVLSRFVGYKGWDDFCAFLQRNSVDSDLFVAEAENTKMQPGDTFSCTQFQVGKELHLDYFCRQGSPERYRYVAGINSGITILEIL